MGKKVVTGQMGEKVQMVIILVTRIYWRYAPINPRPFGGLGCGPSANIHAARNWTSAMCARKQVKKISIGTLSH
jgi:hypothetical protein